MDEDPLSCVSYLCIVYVYNDCHRMNQNHRSKMGRTSHFSDAYNAFSSSCFLFLFGVDSDDDEFDESDYYGSGSRFTSVL